MRFAPSRHSYGVDAATDVTGTLIPNTSGSEQNNKGGWLLAAGIPVVLGVVLLPTFVVGPFVVKAIKPEWSYGRRLGASLAFSMVVGALTRIARARKEPK